ncbi:MAG: signal transduction histidine kinase [Flavobacteriaceae bacterium]|jgi:signal transduction histidine kinase
MFKKILVIAPLLFLFITSTTAQSLEDYIGLAESSRNNVEKLISLDSVLSKSFRADSEVFINYSLVYIDLAMELDSIESAAKKAMNLQSVLVNTKMDPKKAVNVINGVLLQKSGIKDSFLLGGLYLKKGIANSKLDLKSAISDYNVALLNFAIRDSIHRADTYLYRGHAYSYLGDFVAAGDDYDSAYSYYESLEDYDYMLRAQQGKITMFSLHGFYDLARSERHALIGKLVELNRTEFIETEYYNQSLDYQKTGNRELQLQFLLKAKEFQDDSQKNRMYINIHSKLAEYYSTNNNLKKAKGQLDLIEPYLSEIRGDRFAELSYSGAKSSYLMAIGDLDVSLDFAQIKLENAVSLGIEDQIMGSYLMLSEIYRKRGDFEKSLENKDHYSGMRDSLYYRRNANSLTYYQSRFDIQEKEKEFAKQNLDIRLLERDSETFKNLMFFVSLAIMLLFGIVLLYRNRQNLNSKKNLQEVFSQKLLVSQERERRRISKDLHDGIGQQLLLIKNKLILMGDQETKEMVDMTIDEIRNISQDLHPFALQELGITRAIEHTLQRIDENTTLFISSEIDNIDDLFSPEEEVNIYRIVQESLSNIIKHANAEASKVLVKKYKKNISISIKDNGVGFDFPEKYQDKKSLGLKTLLERTKFLKGQMKVVSKKENGTLIEFKFPIQ